MRVFRTILGMLLLTIGLPALLAGGGLWAVMQHRDPGGAFSGELEKLAVPGYAVVVPDVDRLLRDDAPFARVGDTQLRLNAATADGQAFVGLAPAADVSRYLAGVPHLRVRGVDIGTGDLPVTTSRLAGPRVPGGLPGQQDIWIRSGQGSISWTPGELGSGSYSLVMMNPGGTQIGRLAAVAEVRPGWLNSSTWGLITLGTLLLMAGVIVLVWPGRRREIVYVVEPSQVPHLMHAIGAPLPSMRGILGREADGPGGSGGAHRPRTLADTAPNRPPALPQFSWPPRPAALPAALPAVLPTTLPSSSSSARGPVAPLASVGPAGSVAPDGPQGGGVATATAPAVPDTAMDADARTAGAHTPAPGKPLNLLGETPAMAGLQSGPVPPRRADRRRPASATDIPEFHATAVGAWVAATAPERARQTEARAAARLAEVAARKPGAATPPAQGGSRGASGAGAAAGGAAAGGAAGSSIAGPRKRVAGEQRGPDGRPGSTAAAASASASASAPEVAPESAPEVAPASAPASASGSSAGVAQPAVTNAAISGMLAAAAKVTAAQAPVVTKPAEATRPNAVPETLSKAAKADTAQVPVAGKPFAGKPSLDVEKGAPADGVPPTEKALPETETPAGKASSPAGKASTPEKVPSAEKPDADRPSGGAASPSTTADKSPGTGPAADTASLPGARKSGAGKAPKSRVAGKPAPEAPETRPATLAEVVAQDPPAEKAAAELPAVPRVALRTGPAATDWTATGLTRLAGHQPTAAASKAGPGASLAWDTPVDDKPVGDSQAQARPETPRPAATSGSAGARAAVDAGEKPPVWPPAAVPPVAASATRATAAAAATQAKAAVPAKAPEPAAVSAAAAPTEASAGATKADLDGGADVPAATKVSVDAVEKGDAVPAAGREDAASKTASPAEEPGNDGAGAEQPASPKRPIVPFPKRPVGAPGPAGATSGKAEGDSVQNLEAIGADQSQETAPVPADEPAAVTGQQEPEADQQPAVPEQGNADRSRAADKKRTAAAKPGAADNPLTRAQNRLTGKPASQAGKQTAARRAPAAWIKAAESMAARVAGKPTEEPVPETQARTQAPAQSSAPAHPEAPAKSQQAKGQEAKSAPTPAPGRAKTEAKTAAPAQAKAATRAEVKPGTPAEGMAPAPAEAKGSAPAAAQGQEPDQAPSSGPDPKSRPGGDKPRPKPAPLSGTAAEKAAARALSYREEAAELLAGTTERRRRRTVAGRPAADRDRAKDQPDPS